MRKNRPMRIIHVSAVLLLAACSVSVVRTPPPAEVSDAERVVQRQVDAFNRRDPEAFMATYAPDAIHWEYPADTVFNGKDRIRAHYTELLTDPEVHGLHVDVRTRIVKGRFVIDEDVYQGLPGDEGHVSVVIYEVRDGFIQNVWFMN
jgi:uncharacterized protein (TIGR02246 family)